MRWYVSNNGQTVGPVEETAVIEGLKSGQIHPTASFRDEAASAWVPLAQTPFAALAPKPKPKGLTPIQIIAGFVLGVGGIIWWAGYSDISKSSGTAAAEEAKHPDQTDAWVMAKQFVKDALKSPGTADFGSPFKDYQDPKTHVTELGGGKFQVTGWVDAQNGFGATVRNNFTVTVQNTGGDNWRTIEGPSLSER